MTKWRPEEWKPLWTEEQIKSAPESIRLQMQMCFEDGADAMLEALRKRGRGLHLPGNVPTDNAEGLVRIPLALQNVPQTIVIIPDEEVSFPLVCGSCHTRHSPEEACPPRSEGGK